METAGNTEKKAGALNQQLSRLLPQSEHHDVVLVMDADSTLAPEFLEVALGLMEGDPSLIAVGGLFYGENGGASSASSSATSTPATNGWSRASSAACSS